MGLFLPYIAVVGALAVSTVAQLQQGTSDSFAAWIRSFIILALIGRQVLSLLENLLAGPAPGGAGGRADGRAAGQRAALPGAGPAQLRGRHPGRPDANVEYVSESMTRVFGYSEAHLLGRPLTEILDSDAGIRLREGLAEVAERPYGVLELELPLRHRDGHHCTVQFTITNLLDNPSVGGLVLNTRDISERRQLEDQLVHQAFHDRLTGLANRALFKDRVDHALLADQAPDPLGGGAVPRPGRLQGGQRQPRPRRRRPAAHPGRPSGCAPACGRATPWPGSAATSSPS